MPGSLFDINVWLAAIFTSHPFHPTAQQVLQQATPAEPAVFFRSTQQSFLRLVSTPTLLKAYGAEGLNNRDALLALSALLALPQVCEREEPPGVLALWHRLATCDTASPKVWMDAYLAAFAIGGGLRMLRTRPYIT
jgi:toxin-antitoxin system PIN domain toxin